MSNKIVFLGSTSVGKTSLIKAISGEKNVLNQKPSLQNDIKQIKTFVDGDEVYLSLWDTAGQETFRSLTKS